MGPHTAWRHMTITRCLLWQRCAFSSGQGFSLQKEEAESLDLEWTPGSILVVWKHN